MPTAKRKNTSYGPTKEYRRAVGRRVRLIRTVLGLTEKQAASDCGLSRKKYARIEAGDTEGNFDIAAFQAFCARHDVDLNYLFAGDASGLPSSLTRNAGATLAVLPVTRPWRRATI